MHQEIRITLKRYALHAIPDNIQVPLLEERLYTLVRIVPQVGHLVLTRQEGRGGVKTPVDVIS